MVVVVDDAVVDAAVDAAVVAVVVHRQPNWTHNDAVFQTVGVDTIVASATVRQTMLLMNSYSN
jgi:hypothetical protein